MNELHRFIEPAGIVTLCFLLGTLALGLNIHRNRKVLLPWHKKAGDYYRMYGSCTSGTGAAKLGCGIDEQNTGG